MNNYLDTALEQWAISNVCPNTGIVQTEYELRAVKQYMAQGFRLLAIAQPAIDALRSENAELIKMLDEDIAWHEGDCSPHAQLEHEVARLQKAVESARRTFTVLADLGNPASRLWLTSNPEPKEEE